MCGRVNIKWGSVNFGVSMKHGLMSYLLTVKPAVELVRRFFLSNIMDNGLRYDIVLVTLERSGYCITSVPMCHRAVRCPYLTREPQPGSLVSVGLTCPLRPRYSLTTHTHTSTLQPHLSNRFVPP